VSLLSVSSSYSGAQSPTAKFIEIICADFAIFHVYSIQIYFESKYSKKLIFGLKSIGFDIPLHASLLESTLSATANFLGALIHKRTGENILKPKNFVWRSEQTPTSVFPTAHSNDSSNQISLFAQLGES